MNDISKLRDEAAFWEERFREAVAANLPYGEVEIVRSTWKLAAWELARAEADTDDTVLIADIDTSERSQ
jgi:hypothetical protein